MTPDELREARTTLGRIWGFKRDLSRTELVRVSFGLTPSRLRLIAPKPGAGNGGRAKGVRGGNRPTKTKHATGETQMATLYLQDVSRFANAADEARALEAAAEILIGVDIEDTMMAYNVAINEGDDPREVGGLAGVWDRALSAANMALTEGWQNRTDEGCCLYAA